ncbi:hypothetical protein SPRG_19118 [Saprolegnia parasitica CBS 223.65]|uniref:Uncharacterized protein n=1 Tax=Saprolegnia parasitica (strain CBS 223.65) TaxID=695850 RepID=A0A067D6K0_SAPPC|nr:hypothetical protein SPRG_19118 [Saprolegnia parasitica CBS 223.65]KDO34301.1 hypothetical protein SPRG_19118 [Saprolegnia parasitica CBS 223.65]|eukprot:XP_012195311.1 hypothetical protein SPRG_19118 [Saprolegnia parasitica CBS 223.65]
MGVFLRGLEAADVFTSGSSLVRVIIYVLFGMIGVIVLAILYLLWSMYRESLQDTASAPYVEVTDEHGEAMHQADTICSRGVGIRCDNAETRPTLRSLRTMDDTKDARPRPATLPHPELRHTMSLPVLHTATI